MRIWVFLKRIGLEDSKSSSVSPHTPRCISGGLAKGTIALQKPLVTYIKPIRGFFDTPSTNSITQVLP